MAALEQGVRPGPAWLQAPGGLPEPEEAQIAAADCLEVAPGVRASAASAWVADLRSLVDALQARVLAAFLWGLEAYAVFHQGRAHWLDYQTGRVGHGGQSS